MSWGLAAYVGEAAVRQLKPAGRAAITAAAGCSRDRRWEWRRDLQIDGQEGGVPVVGNEDKVVVAVGRAATWHQPGRL